MAHVLIVDDSKAIRQHVMELLPQVFAEKVEVLEAADAPTALDLFRRHAPEYVLLDIVLREGSSVETLTTMLEERPGARVVLVSGLAPESPEVVAALSQGARAYCRKPVDVTKLREAFKAASA